MTVGLRMLFNAELMPRRRRGGMRRETLASVSPVARRVGQAIALCGLSCFAVSRQTDRRQKAIVCPTGIDAESMSCGWVSGEKTRDRWRESCQFRREFDLAGTNGRLGLQPGVS